MCGVLRTLNCTLACRHSSEPILPCGSSSWAAMSTSGPPEDWEVAEEALHHLEINEAEVSDAKSIDVNGDRWDALFDACHP